MTTVDFLVIGAGIAGASVASALVEHGSVVLLEAEDHPGYHATGRSASIFMELHRNITMRALLRRSFPFLENSPDGFSEDPILSARGALFIARSDQHSSLSRLVDECVTDSSRIVIGDDHLALSKHPALRDDYVSACVWNPDAFAIDVHALLHGYLRACRRSEGKLMTRERLVTLQRNAGHWIAHTDKSAYHAAVVVNAAGAWADEVGRLAGARTIGLVPKMRSACIVPVDTMSVDNWPAVGDVDGEFYFMPESGNLLLSPSEQTTMRPGDVHADELEIARAVECLEAATSIRVKHKLRRQWAGLRSFVGDDLPVVGYDPDVDGFFWLAGLGGDGIKTAPALARLAAALAMHRPVPADLLDAGLQQEALSPERLP